MGRFIHLNSDVHRAAETKRLRTLLGDRRADAYLVRLWLWMAQFHDSDDPAQSPSVSVDRAIKEALGGEQYGPYVIVAMHTAGFLEVADDGTFKTKTKYVRFEVP